MYRTGWNDTHRFSLFPVTIQSRPRSPPSFYSSTSEPSLFSFGCAIPFSKKRYSSQATRRFAAAAGFSPFPFCLFPLSLGRSGEEPPDTSGTPSCRPPSVYPAAVRMPGSADRPFFQLPPKPDQVHSRCRRSLRTSSRNTLSGIDGQIGPCSSPTRCVLFHLAFFRIAFR